MRRATAATGNVHLAHHALARRTLTSSCRTFPTCLQATRRTAPATGPPRASYSRKRWPCGATAAAIRCRMAPPPRCCGEDEGTGGWAAHGLLLLAAATQCAFVLPLERFGSCWPLGQRCPILCLVMG